MHHGAGPASEPETQALDAAAQLGPADSLRIYTDVHSFSQVHFWSSNGNSSLTYLTEKVLRVFSRHHQAFPAGKYYYFTPRSAVRVNQGIGVTQEYFTYQLPGAFVDPGNRTQHGATTTGPYQAVARLRRQR